MDLFAPQAGLLPLPLDDGELGWMAQLPLPWSNADVFARLLAETDCAK